MAATKGQIKERKNGDEADRSGNGSLTRKAYDRELARLHGELVKLQQWVVAKGLKVVIVFEGRDGAAKAGSSKLSPNGSVPASFASSRCPRPRTRKGEMHIQRYIRHLPAAGEIVMLDRSWYDRAGVERVMEFCSMELVRRSSK